LREKALPSSFFLLPQEKDFSLGGAGAAFDDTG
jgi:hypothetical protein